jgi:GNAT superfamily N-acetyltransferase
VTTKIRQAQLDDAEAMARVIVDGWHTTYGGIMPDDFLESMKASEHAKGTRELLKRLGDDSRALVAERDGEIVGTIIVTPPIYPVADFKAEIVSFYVLRSYQRHGVGAALLREIAQWLLATGRSNLFIWLLSGSPFGKLGERFAAEQIPGERTERIGETTLTLHAWGWRDLKALMDVLAGRMKDEG